MSDVPVQLVVAAFQDEKSAKAALNELKEAQREKLIKIEDAAVLRKDEKGKLHMHEVHDWGGGKGAVVGGLIGAAVGIIFPPGILLAGAAGALIGGLSAKLRDSGFDDNRLKKLGEGLEPGTSAIIAVVEHRWVAQVQDKLDEYAVDMFTEDISADIAEQLQEGKQLSISAIGTQEGFAVERVTADEESVEVERMAVTDDAVVAGRAVITDEGIAGERLTETDDTTVYEAGVVTEDVAAFAEVVATDEGVVAAGVAAIAEEEDEAPEALEAEGEEAEGDTEEEEK
ncbi:MAG: DUF1269 domain-containing protein [Chloroflexota bacterium]|nr:DUF1269 domain-containing protein [Chloroflexota bacterium]